MTRLLPLAVLLAAGCGGRTADVSGTVTYQGKPVVYGVVVLFGPDGLSKSGEIRPDGTFTVTGVAVGTANVAVSSPPPPGAEQPAGKKPRGGRDAADDDKPPPPSGPAVDPAVVKGWVALPEKYGDPAKSGLTVTVGSGGPVALDLK